MGKALLNLSQAGLGLFTNVLHARSEVGSALVAAAVHGTVAYFVFSKLVFSKP
jgi:hypothetical protein